MLRMEGKRLELKEDTLLNPAEERCSQAILGVWKSRKSSFYLFFSIPLRIFSGVMGRSLHL